MFAMDADEFALRRRIIDACLTMNARGFNQGKSGNVSVRFGESLLITPTSLPYEQLTPEDLAQMPIDGEYGSWVGPHAPSTEWRFHIDIARSRPEVGAIVHTHSLYATVLGICGREIPAIHYMIATCGGPTVRLAPYATFGTQELSDHVLEALGGRNACLLANHGAIAIGPDLRYALALAEELENLARQYFLAIQLGGAVILPDDEVAKVMERMKNYGFARATPGAND